MKNNDMAQNAYFECNKFNEFIKNGFNIQEPNQFYFSFLHEGDLAILFGPPHCGKSILAVMIAESICNLYKHYGNNSKVLYIDFELTNKQISMRYAFTHTDRFHQFPESLLRITFHEDIHSRISDNSLFEDLEKFIVNNNVKSVIVDSISFLAQGKKGTFLNDIFLKLTSLKNNCGLTMLVVANSLKKINSTPISLADLPGNAFLSVIADSIFALNFSTKGYDIRYVKQLKSNSDRIRYGDDNVLEYKIIRDNDGMTLLDFLHNTTEDEQIGIDIIAQEELGSQVRILRGKGWAYRKIADKFSISPSKAYRFCH
ncbi:MAG: AAA family ATPase [Prevotella sp.]|nr:AAA family ATPase [Prevotella sp.]